MSKAKRLRKTRTLTEAALLDDGAWLCGVCAGVARYFRISPAIVRIVAVIGLVWFTVAAVIAYFGLWLLFFRP